MVNDEHSDDQGRGQVAGSESSDTSSEKSDGANKQMDTEVEEFVDEIDVAREEYLAAFSADVDDAEVNQNQRPILDIGARGSRQDNL